MTTSKNDKLVFRVVLLVSVLVFAAVVLLNERVFPVPETIPAWVYKLPLLNAVINATCSILLGLSYSFIRRKQVQRHKTVNLITFALSSVFLISYITYHWLAGHTVYPADAPVAGLYKIILLSHIVLAAVVLPLVLLSFHRGLQMQVEKHRKLVRWTFPIWLYVTTTGVIVYLMISPYYAF